jgi:hypothetical protein
MGASTSWNPLGLLYLLTVSKTGSVVVRFEVLTALFMKIKFS